MAPSVSCVAFPGHVLLHWCAASLRECVFILAEVSVDNTYQKSSNLLLDLEPFDTNETLIRNPVKFTDLELMRLKKEKRVQSPLHLSYLFPLFFFFSMPGCPEGTL